MLVSSQRIFSLTRVYLTLAIVGSASVVAFYGIFIGNIATIAVLSVALVLLVSNKFYKYKKSGNDVLDNSQLTYIIALLFVGIFIASAAILLGGVGRVFSSISDVPTLLTVFTAIVSAIGTVSSTILAWRSDRRDARDKELRIAQLERELEAAREKPSLPTPEENRQ